MKKISSIILAGALCLTSISIPVSAETSLEVATESVVSSNSASGDATPAAANLDEPVVEETDVVSANSLEELVSALETTEEGKTIQLETNIEGNISITNPIALDLNGYSISGNSVSEPVIDITANAIVKNGIITNGSNSGIKIRKTNATLENLEIINNSNTLASTSDGGGLEVVGYLKYCGSATDWSNITVNINNCNITNNIASDGGGGIAALYGASLVINSTQIQSNTSNSGGALYFGDNAAETSIYNSIISANNAEAIGGGLYTGLTSIVTIENTIFEGNTSTSQGGAVCNYFGENIFKNCSFEKNISASGGAIYQYYGKVNLEDSEIINNSASSYYGGGLCAIYGVQTSIKNTEMQNNTAVYGGGICLCGSKAEVKASNIYNNIASTAGDDIFSYYNSTLELDKVSDNLILEKTKEKIDNWYYDNAKERWSIEDNHLTIVSEDEVITLNCDKEHYSYSLKAAHGVIEKEPDKTESEITPIEPTIPTGPTTVPSTPSTPTEPTVTPTTPEEIVTPEEPSDDTTVEEKEEEIIIDSEEENNSNENSNTVVTNNSTNNNIRPAGSQTRVTPIRAAADNAEIIELVTSTIVEEKTPTSSSTIEDDKTPLAINESEDNKEVKCIIHIIMYILTILYLILFAIVGIFKRKGKIKVIFTRVAAALVALVLCILMFFFSACGLDIFVFILGILICLVTAIVAKHFRKPEEDKEETEK